jgi:glycosyltransferase involved in cell wall biosynthesis
VTPEPLRIIALPGDLGACGYYRVFAPLDALERAGLAQVTRLKPTAQAGGKQQIYMRRSEVRGHDIALLQRQPEERIYNLIQYAQSIGVCVVFDVDDDVYSVPSNSPAYLAWGRDWRKIGGLGRVDDGSITRRLGAETGEQKSIVPTYPRSKVLEHAAHEWTDQAKGNFKGLIRNLRAADLVTVSTERLCQVYGRLRDDIIVLNNQIEPRDWEQAISDPHPKPKDEIWIGWAGSKTHWPDLREISGAVTAVLRRNPQARLVIAGFPEVVQHLFKEAQDQVITFDWMPITEYRRVVAAFDIALAPSAPIQFNEAKSDIRVLEAALCGVPVVASEATYGPTVRGARCGFTAKTSQKWIKHLTRLVRNPAQRHKMGAAGQHYVENNRTYDANAWRWAEAYQRACQLMKQKAGGKNQ